MGQLEVHQLLEAATDRFALKDQPLNQEQFQVLIQLQNPLALFEC
jgi:hypothetical protein